MALRILFLTTVLPRQRRIGSEVASQAIIDGLRRCGHEVDVVGYMRQEAPFVPDAQEHCAGLRPIESRGAPWHAAWWILRSLLQARPYSATKYLGADYRAQVATLLARGDHGLIVIDHAQMAWLLEALPARHAPLATIAHNVEHEAYAGQARAARRGPLRWLYAREARLIEQAERALAQSAAEVWVFTASDARAYARLGRAGVTQVLELPTNVAGTVHAAAAPGPANRQFDIGLIGSWSWAANAEALQWFLSAVLPRLPAQLSIQVAGGGAGWLAGRHPNVHYRGFVEDARVFLRQARVVAIPTLSGGGIQLKTLEAIASGTRVVATTPAVRGIDAPPASVQVHDLAEGFAQALVQAVGAGEDERLVAEATQWTIQRETRFIQRLGERTRALTTPQ